MLLLLLRPNAPERRSASYLQVNRSMAYYASDRPRHASNGSDGRTQGPNHRPAESKPATGHRLSNSDQSLRVLIELRGRSAATNGTIKISRGQLAGQRFNL